MSAFGTLKLENPCPQSEVSQDKAVGPDRASSLFVFKSSIRTQTHPSMNLLSVASLHSHCGVQEPDSDLLACRAENVYFLRFCRKSLLTPALGKLIANGGV